MTLMNAIHAVIALLAGGLLAAQAGFNSRLGVLVNNALLASVAAFLTAFLSAGALYAVVVRKPPTPTALSSVPPHLWVTGGVLSALAVSSFYWLIPKLGLSSVIVCGVAGQLITSMVAAHFGWFGLPSSPLNSIKLLGAVTLLIGTLLVAHG